MAGNARPKDMPKELNYKGLPRQRKEKAIIDKEELTRLSRLHLTNEEMAEWFNCAVSVLSTEPYKTIIHKGKSEIKQRLKQKAIQRALQENSDTMLIFCLKNYCGWNDNKQSMDVTINNGPTQAPTLVELYTQLDSTK